MDSIEPIRSGKPQLLGRTPPHDPNAERAVLGAMLLSEDCQHEMAEMLVVDDFYSRSHRTIYAAMQALLEKNREIDTVIIGDHLSKGNKLDEIGGSAFLDSLTQDVPTLANASYYAGIVKSKSQLRQLLQLTMEVQESIFAEGDTEQSFELAEGKMGELSEKRVKNNSNSISGLMSKVMNEFMDRLNGNDNTKGLSCHYHNLMRKLVGFRGGEMLVIAARPSMGKTSFALNIILDLAVRQGVPAALFSLEMPAVQIANNMVCIEAAVDNSSWRNPVEAISETDSNSLHAALDRISASNIIIDDDGYLTPTTLRSKLRRYKRDHGIRIAFIDYLQLMSEPRVMREGRVQEMSYISRSVKAIAKELDIPIVALAQLNRGSEVRQTKIPVMADLRESGSIEQDADAVILLHRPEYYEPNTRPGEADIILAKNRNGETGTVTLNFVKHMMRFENTTHAGERG